MLSKRYESTEVERRTWQHVPSGKLWSTSNGTHLVVEVMCTWKIYEGSICHRLNVWEKNEKEARGKKKKVRCMHRLVLSFLGLFYSDIRRAYAFCSIWKGGVWWSLPRINFGTICAELWYSGPTWTKNSAYRTVPFLDFWGTGMVLKL